MVAPAPAETTVAPLLVTRCWDEDRSSYCGCAGAGGGHHGSVVGDIVGVLSSLTRTIRRRIKAIKAMSHAGTTSVQRPKRHNERYILGVIVIVIAILPLAPLALWTALIVSQVRA